MLASLSDNVKSFLSSGALHHSIAGKWKQSDSTKHLDVYNPSDGTRLCSIANGSAADVDAAVKAATDASGKWAALPVVERAVMLHRFAELLDKHAGDLALLESLDVGKAVTAARGFDVPFGIDAIRYFADLSTKIQYDVPLAIKGMEARTHRAPLGACGFVFPWNFPFTLLMWGIAPALSAGNTVVVKPSEVTPLSTLYVAHLLQETGVLPAGVFNVVLGDGPNVGGPLSAHPGLKHMSFTGSPGVGRMVAESTGRNLVQCKLELGGKGAAVVFDDVDVSATAKALAGAITLNTGQVCCTATRWLVHEKVFDQFVTEAKSALGSTIMGPSLDESTQMGPLASNAHKQRVLGYLQRGREQGATMLLEPSTASEKGYFVAPSLMSGAPDNVCCREEIFGPTAFVMKFNDEDNAIKLVNSLTYGLANSVWSTDLTKAARVAEQMVAGNSWINAHNVFAYGLPYGGVNLSGLGGGVNSPETLLNYLRSQTIARPL